MWVAREVKWESLGGSFHYGGLKRWSVEAKEFEVMIKGGMSGVRIVERRKGKQRSIFVHRNEIS